MTEPTVDATLQLYLASASPRRHELLTLIGVRFERLVVDVDESVQPSESPEHYVGRLALAKARAGQQAQIFSKKPDTIPVMGADTCVVVDEHILGKPQNRDDGLQMLTRLSGREHKVLSAVAIVRRQQQALRIQTSRVRFRQLSLREREAYWATGEPADKAGSYGIQGFGAMFIAELHGSHSGVMGLPLYETAELLREFNIDILQTKQKNG
jgi:septum formation protein